ncbi:cation-transporting ATPase [Aureococcus anophagefferens]|nr:cation-transporting ATPase [Aureococcus anophagefferens]
MPSADDDAAHVLRIGGMTCGHCVGAVTSALEGVAGVARADVDLERGLATVAAAPGASLALADLVDAVEASGFDASDAAGGGGAATTQTLAVEGMSCGQCDDGTAAVAGAADPAALAGAVRAAGYHLAGERQAPRRARSRRGDTKDGDDATWSVVELRVEGMTCAACASRVAKALRSATTRAFKPTTMVWTSPARRARKLARVAEVRAFRRRGVAFALAAPVFVVMMLVIPYGARDAVLALQSNALAGRSRYLAVEALGSLLLATPVQFVLGFRFYVGAFNSLRYGTANMDVLVALGTSAAYFYSIYCSGGGGHGHHGSHADDADCVSGHHFFETSSVLIAFVLLGKFMEAKAKGRTSEALQALLSLQPKMATVSHTMDDGGDYEEVVDAGSLSRGDVVKIKPGEAVPADGAVVSGESNCDESMLTGESMPVEKRPADDDKEAAGKVYGGTINAGPGASLAAARRRGTAAAALADALLDAVGVAEGGSEHPLASALVATAAEARGGRAGGPAVQRRRFGARRRASPRRCGADDAAAPELVLHSNLGIEVWMLTGDNERTAQAIARQCGISRVLAKVRPDDKARNVTSLMDQGHVVAMVGDGVNDSPALAAADLGVAIGAGAQIAVETADVVLIRSVLDDVATAIEPPSASPRAGDGDPTLCSCAVRCCSVRFHCGADRAAKRGGPALVPGVNSPEAAVMTRALAVSVRSPMVETVTGRRRRLGP